LLRRKSSADHRTVRIILGALVERRWLPWKTLPWKTRLGSKAASSRHAPVGASPRRGERRRIGVTTLRLRSGRAHRRPPVEAITGVRLDILQDQLGATDVDAIADAQATLVDALPVDIGAGIIAEVDERYLARARHFDHRVHARRCRIVHPKMALRVAPYLDDVVRDRVTADELAPLIGGERYDSLCHTFVGPCG